MTTLTIDKELLEQVVNKLLTCWPKSDPLVNELRAALAAPATAPDDQLLKDAERYAPAPAPAWPTMPPRKGQSHVLFEDGYDEGWAKCLEACKAMFAAPATAPDDQLLKDAERYRWCVDNNLVLAGGTREFGWQIAPVGREWNRFIDAAMKGTP